MSTGFPSSYNKRQSSYIEIQSCLLCDSCTDVTVLKSPKLNVILFHHSELCRTMSKGKVLLHPRNMREMKTAHVSETLYMLCLVLNAPPFLCVPMCLLLPAAECSKPRGKCPLLAWPLLPGRSAASRLRPHLPPEEAGRGALQSTVGVPVD